MNYNSYPEMALFILRPSVRIFHSFIPSFNLLLSCFFGDRRVEFLVNGPIVAHFFFTAPVAYCRTCQISSPHCSCLNTAWTVDRCIDNICLCLHQEIVGTGSAIYLQERQVNTGIRLTFGEGKGYLLPFLLFPGEVYVISSGEVICIDL